METILGNSREHFDLNSWFGPSIEPLYGSNTKTCHLTHHLFESRRLVMNWRDRLWVDKLNRSLGLIFMIHTKRISRKERSNWYNTSKTLHPIKIRMTLGWMKANQILEQCRNCLRRDRIGNQCPTMNCPFMK